MNYKYIFKMLLIVWMTILTSGETMADGGGEKRKNCLGPLRYRYKGWASISSKVQSRYRKCESAACSGITVDCQEISCVGCGGWPKSQYGHSITYADANGIRNHLSGDPKYFNFGFNKNQNIYSVLSVNRIDTALNMVAHADVNAGIDWEDINSPTNNNVKWTSFNTSIVLPLGDETSRFTYELIIWEATDDYDSTVTDAKILWHTGFVYTNNFIVRTGLLLNGIVAYSMTDSSRTMTLTLDSLKTILIPSLGTSIRIRARLHKDDIGDASSTMIPSNDNKGGILNEMGLQDMNAYQPDLNSLKIDLNFNNELKSDSKIIKVSIYNIEGKLINNILNPVITEENKNITILADLKGLNLPNNVYFVKIDYNDKALYYRMYLNNN